MKFYFILIFFLIATSKSLALENKIVLKIENEIITSLDIVNEKNYLIALNPNIKNLDANRLKKISKDSLIREKIKEIEILKYTETIKLDKHLAK